VPGISQGSVATSFRCGGNFSVDLTDTAGSEDERISKVIPQSCDLSG